MRPKLELGSRVKSFSSLLLVSVCLFTHLSSSHSQKIEKTTSQNLNISSRTKGVSPIVWVVGDYSNWPPYLRALGRVKQCP